MKDQVQLIALFNKYLANQCSLAEVAELMQYFNSSESEFLQEKILHEFESLDLVQENYPALPENIFEGIKARITKNPPVVRRSLWSRIAVAASIAIAVMAGGYFYYSNQNIKPKPQLAIVNDIAPGSTGATLTLANGQKIRLTDAKNGKLAEQAGVVISKTAKGELIYDMSKSPATKDAEGKERFNTLSTTNGETYQVRLPDGTAVWLNAASSISYPVNFASLRQRKVKLEGEAYFEVAKDKAHPFVVSTATQQVEVLGTHFNINSYSNEPLVRTTLLEGSVKVSEPETGNAKLLTPNQQAILFNGNFKTIPINGEDAIAWKNGLFAFGDESLESIMKRVARWYNVTVEYQQGVDKNELYGGSVSRSEKVSKVLAHLEATGGIHFKLEGRRIVVTK